jgi:hypothetical protein
MNESSSNSGNRQSPVISGVVEIFDPPMCCSSGLCGPTIDQTLLDLSEAILTLERAGVKVARYQMTSQTDAFLGNSEVMRLVGERNTAALPITVVNDVLIKTGAYPSLAEMEAALNGGNSG